MGEVLQSRGAKTEGLCDLSNIPVPPAPGISVVGVQQLRASYVHGAALSRDWHGRCAKAVDFATCSTRIDFQRVGRCGRGQKKLKALATF